MLAKIILILIAPQLLQIASAQVPQGSAAKSCATTTPLSLREALSLAAADNLSVAIAETAIGSAEATRKQLNSTWFPTLLVTGKYTHTTSPIGIETSLGQMGSGLLPTLAPLIGSNPQLAEIVGDIAATPIGLSLVPRNTASVGADLVWPIFSGGRRLKASSIGDLMVELGHLQYDASLSRTIAEVTTAYFTLSLAESVVELRREAVTTLRQHLHDAQRLEEEGMIVTAERLVAEVNCEQANIELAAAESDVIVARRALVALLKGLRVKLRGFRPIEEAIVTRGGVSVREINPKTMESRCLSGLYFAGEVLDVDAYTGGFNLQIAFSTAVVAGENAAWGGGE